MTHSLYLGAPGRALPLAALLVLTATLALPLRAQDTPLQEITEPETFLIVEQAPEPLPDMQTALTQMQERIEYPQIARDAGAEGRVIVQFVVDETGQVVEVKTVATDVRYAQNADVGEVAGLFSREAERVVQMLTFRPGEQRGEAKRVRMTLPVRFSLDRGQGSGRVEGPVGTQFERSARADDVFLIVDTPPQLLPSQQEALDALQDALVYPELAQRAGVEGRVIVQFVVDERGQAVDPVVVRGIGAGADEEAIRLIRTLRFTPGSQRGQAVKVQMTLPVTFRLAPEETGSVPPNVRRTIERTLDRIDRSMTHPTPEAYPRLIAEIYGSGENTEQILNEHRRDNPSIQLAAVSGYVSATGTRALRIESSACPNDNDEVIEYASKLARTDIGGEEYPVTQVMLCPAE
jgi:TonB family protein